MNGPVKFRYWYDTVVLRDSLPTSQELYKKVFPPQPPKLPRKGVKINDQNKSDSTSQNNVDQSIDFYY